MMLAILNLLKGSVSNGVKINIIFNFKKHIYTLHLSVGLLVMCVSVRLNMVRQMRNGIAEMICVI
jgi:hypothetical protein